MTDDPRSHRFVGAKSGKKEKTHRQRVFDFFALLPTTPSTTTTTHSNGMRPSLQALVGATTTRERTSGTRANCCITIADVHSTHLFSLSSRGMKIAPLDASHQVK